MQVALGMDLGLLRTELNNADLTAYIGQLTPWASNGLMLLFYGSRVSDCRLLSIHIHTGNPKKSSIEGPEEHQPTSHNNRQQP